MFKKLYPPRSTAAGKTMVATIGMNRQEIVNPHFSHYSKPKNAKKLV